MRSATIVPVKGCREGFCPLRAASPVLIVEKRASQAGRAPGRSTFQDIDDCDFSFFSISFPSFPFYFFFFFYFSLSFIPFFIFLFFSFFLVPSTHTTGHTRLYGPCPASGVLYAKHEPPGGDAAL